MNRRSFLGTVIAAFIAPKPSITLQPSPALALSLPEPIAPRLAELQRQYNYALSSCVEMVSLVPRAPYFHADSR